MPLHDRVRLTSIYSKGAGVVRWQAQLVPAAASTSTAAATSSSLRSARPTGKILKREIPRP